MIKAHPVQAMLRAFAADELPLPLAVGVSAHCELCPDCAARLRACEEELARQYLAPAEECEPLRRRSMPCWPASCSSRWPVPPR